MASKTTKRARTEAEDLRPVRLPGGAIRYVSVAEGADPTMFDDEAVNEESVQDAALAGVMTELGARDDDAKVSVYKVENSNGIRREAFLYECHPNAFTLGDLQESYGAGDYRIKVYGAQEGTNYKVIHANKKITIGPTRSQMKAANAAPVAAAPAAVAAGTDPALAAILGNISQALAELRKSSGGNSRAEMLAELKTMAEIAGISKQGSSGELAGLTGALTLLGTMKGILGGGAGGVESDPDAAPYQLMGKALETFSEMYRTARSGGAVAAEGVSATAPALPAPAVPSPPAPPVAVSPEDDEMNIIVRGQILMMLAAARMNDSPEKWSQRIYEDAPDEMLAAIEAPDWFEKLCALEKGFAAVRPWLEKTRALVLEEIALAASDAGALETGSLTGAAGPDTKVAPQAGGETIAIPGGAKPA